MLRLDKIFFDAITSDAELMTICGYEAPSAAYPQGKPARIKSTCFEVSPDEQDNTQLPYILILDEGKHPAQTTKDDEWMPSQWRVGAGVEVGAKSPNEVDALVMKAMRAIAAHIVSLSDQGEEIPYLNEGFPQTQGIAWDWTKPCYFDVAHYQCDVDNTNDDEQEESDSGI
jgi:hypothetical protein